jgi:hypothetical protein
MLPPKWMICAQPPFRPPAQAGVRNRQACAGIDGDSCGPCRVFPGYRISRLDVMTPCGPAHVLAADVA